MAPLGHVASRRQGARDGQRRAADGQRQRRVVRPRQRDLDRHREDDHTRATTMRPRCCPMARCSWRAATCPRLPDGLGRAVRSGHGVLDRDCEHARPARATSTATLLRDGTVLVLGLDRRRAAVGRAVRPGHRDLDRAPGAWSRPGISHDGDAAVGWHGAVTGVRSDAAELYDPAPGRGPPPRRMLRPHGTRPRCCSMARSSLRVAVTVYGPGVCSDGFGGAVRPRRRVAAPVAGLPEPAPASHPDPDPEARPRSRPRPVPSRRAPGPGRSRSTTRVPNPRRCSWPRITRAASGGWSGP